MSFRRVVQLGMVFPVFASLGILPATGALRSSVTLSWEQGVGGIPDGYIVQRRSATGAYTDLARPPAPPYTDAAVPTARPVCYQVRAHALLPDGPVVSGPSNEICLNMGVPPGNPIAFTITTPGPAAGEAPSKIEVKSRRPKP